MTLRVRTTAYWGRRATRRQGRPGSPRAEACDVLDPTTDLAADQLAADDQLGDQWRPVGGPGVPRHTRASLGAALPHGRGHPGARAAGLRRADRGRGAVRRATPSLAGWVTESGAAAGGRPPGWPGRAVA